MKPLRINPMNFEYSVLQSDLPVLVVFGSSFNIDSIKLSFELEEIGEEYDGKIVPGFAEINYCIEIFCDYDILDIPTAVFFENGKPYRNRSVGYHGTNTLHEFVKQFYGVLPAIMDY